MKKILALFLVCILMQAQAMAATLPAGSVVHVQPTKEIDADKVKEGDLVEFNVMLPVKVNGVAVIKPGTVVTAQVTKKKNNFILGVPGHIEVGNFRIYVDDKEPITLRGTILDEGDDRYWCHIGWFFLFPVLFVKGDDGKIPMNSNHILYTVDDARL
jgi:hypothetical protein